MYSPFRYDVTNYAFLTWIFLTPLWRTIKNSVRAGSAWEDILEKIITKWKRNKNLKMQVFVQYLTVHIVLTDRKTSLITAFSQMLKIMTKKGLGLSWKGIRDKWLAQIFRKYLTERKPEGTRTRIKLMLSTSPSLVFSHKVHNVRFANTNKNKKANTYSILTNGNRTWITSGGVLN